MKENQKTYKQFYIEALESNEELLDQQTHLIVETIDQFEEQTLGTIEETQEIIDLEEKKEA